MVLPLVAAFIGGLVIGSLIVAFLTLEELMDWFEQNFNLLRKNKNNIAFTIRDTLENGNYQVVQGIFNNRTSEIVEERTIEAEEIDEELEKIHDKYEDKDHVVIYDF